jgi:hypothetical protein
LSTANTCGRAARATSARAPRMASGRAADTGAGDSAATPRPPPAAPPAPPTGAGRGAGGAAASGGAASGGASGAGAATCSTPALNQLVRHLAHAARGPTNSRSTGRWVDAWPWPGPRRCTKPHSSGSGLSSAHCLDASVGMLAGAASTWAHRAGASGPAGARPLDTASANAAHVTSNASLRVMSGGRPPWTGGSSGTRRRSKAAGAARRRARRPAAPGGATTPGARRRRSAPRCRRRRGRPRWWQSTRAGWLPRLGPRAWQRAGSPPGRRGRTRPGGAARAPAPSSPSQSPR